METIKDIITDQDLERYIGIIGISFISIVGFVSSCGIAYHLGCRKTNLEWRKELTNVIASIQQN